MRYLLLLPGIILILLPILSARHAAVVAERQQRQQEAEQAAAAQRRRIEAEHDKALKAAKAAEREKARADREARQQRKQAERLEAARQRAEYAERELAAKREMQSLSRKSDADESQPDQPAAEPAKPEPVSIVLPAGNNAFKGQVVSFTGRLPGMTRREAIEAVVKNGGKAFAQMPAATTLLVVGDKPGMCKLDKADEWIAQVRKITAAQFFQMLEQPLTLELDEFAALFAKEVA